MIAAAADSSLGLGLCVAEVVWTPRRICLLGGRGMNSGPVFLQIDSDSKQFTWTDCGESPPVQITGTGAFRSVPPRRENTVATSSPLFYEGILDGNLGLLDANISRGTARIQSSDFTKHIGGPVLDYDDERCTCS